MPVNPTLPTEGGSTGTWGGLLNTAIGAVVTFVNGLETSLAGKAATVHGHTESDVTGLTSDLSSLAAGIAGKVSTSRQVASGTGLTGGGDLTADRTLAVTYGTGEGTACQGNDGRLSDARTPTAHVHSAADITSGTLAVAQGGTGVTTLAALQAALGSGYGADIYRASTGSAAGDTASGARTMVGYDTTRRADTGYTVNHSAGTITVPSDGYYAVSAQARLSAAYTGGFIAMAITDGTTDLIRGPSYQSASGGVLELSVAGTTAFITAGTALRAVPFTSTSTSLVGTSDGARYYLRVVRVG